MGSQSRTELMQSGPARMVERFAIFNVSFRAARAGE